MKKIVAVLVVAVLGFAGVAHADLDGFIRRVNEQAKSDITRFNQKLSSQFGIPVPRVEAIMKAVANPADAFMCLQLGVMAQKQPEAVVQTYQANKGKGWGAIAKDLGIKPGSPEFHALKRGDFALTGTPAGSTGGPGHGKGKGKGRGHGRND